MAFLKKRGKYWYVYFRWGGKQYARSTKTGNKELALKIKSEIETELAFRRFNIPYKKKMPIKNFIDEYFQYAERIKSKNSLRADKYAISKLWLICNPGDFVHSLTSKKIDDLKAELLKEMDATSVNIILRHLRAIFNVAKKWGYIGENPVSISGLIREEKEMPRAIKREDLIKIIELAEIKYPKFAKIIKFALLTGFRRSEIANLKWNDIDWENKLIILHKTKSKKFRVFPLTKALENLLNEIPKQNEYIFNYKADGISHKFLKICKELGIYYKFHDLRRTFASSVFNAGIDLKIVSILLGHQSVTTTERHYLEFATSILREIEGLDAYKMLTQGEIGENKREED
jgi:integrase